MQAKGHRISHEGFCRLATLSGGKSLLNVGGWDVDEAASRRKPAPKVLPSAFQIRASPLRSRTSPI
jgi:hypothetical protein